jgi:phosphate-selective porin
MNFSAYLVVDILHVRKAAYPRCLFSGENRQGTACDREDAMKRISKLLLVGLLLYPVALFSQNAGEEEPSTDDEPVLDSPQAFQISFKNRPSLRIGEFAQIDLKSKWQFDFRGFDPPKVNLPGIVNALPTTPDTFFLNKARFGLKGKVTKYFQYEVERDMRRTFSIAHEYHPWKDNYVDITVHPLLQVKVGKFKIPFGMEENLSDDRQDFALKSRVSDVLDPSRERGVMLHSSFLKSSRLEYQIGVFRYDGEGSDIHGVPTGGRTYAGRLGGQPLRSLKRLPKTIRHVYAGVAATRGGLIAGLNGVNGQTFSGFTYFDHFYVRGDRMRFGTEFAWAEGPFGIKAEYIHMSEERKQQGIRGEDLPDKISRGWYVMGSWTALGKMKSNGRPKDPFLTGHGFGAVELFARFDVVSFYSDGGSGLPSRSPRAPNILPNSERTWTVGPTWYLNHFLKIQANAQRERLTDIERKAVLGRNTFWTGVIRLQVAM